MPVDPQARALLDQMAAAGGPPTSELSPADVRANYLALAALAGQPEEMARVADISIPTPDGAVPARVYTPSARVGLPVLVYYHGGGWVIGNLDTHDTPSRALAKQAECIVVSVDYRLAPEHPFPAAAEDAHAALRWVAEHAAELGGDPSRVAVGGDSAGGNLAAVVSLMARDRGGPPLVFQLLVYPVTNHNLDTGSYQENADGYFLTRDTMRWFWGHYLSHEADGANPYASPLRAPDLTGLPPALVITAQYDPLRDEGEAYGARLGAAGVATIVHRYDGMIHGFFQLAGVLDQGGAAIQEAAGALREAFGSGPHPPAPSPTRGEGEHGR